MALGRTYKISSAEEKAQESLMSWINIQHLYKINIKTLNIMKTMIALTLVPSELINRGYQ